MSGILNVFNGRRQQIQKKMPEISPQLARWAAMYEDRSAKSGEIRSLNLPSAICAELARLATIEFSSEISGGRKGEYLNEQYARVVKKARLFTEYACALGGVILKPYFENGKILVSIIRADGFYPTEFNSSGELTGAIFCETFSEGKYFYTRLEEHKIEDGCVIITNKAYKSRSGDVLGDETDLGEIKRWSGLETYTKIENLDKPLFAYLKMPMVNEDSTMPHMGASAFSRAEDLINDAYLQYSNLLWEFESGKRALYLDECAVRRDEEGNVLLPQKRLYRMLSTGEDTLFEAWSPEFREQSILSGLDRILKSIEFNCGLAYGTISNPQSVDKTAEEVRASKQRSYATVCDIQGAIKKALEDLVCAMNVYCDIYCMMGDEEYSISFNFDDSIICDRTAEFNEKMQLLEKGVISAWELRCWYLGETEEIARERTEKLNEV